MDKASDIQKATMENNSRLQNRKWFIWLLIAVGAIGLFGFEGIWRLKVVDGKETHFITQWIRNNDAIKRIVGDVSSVELRRLRSKLDIGFGSENKGRYHYFVNGTRKGIDVLVTWHGEQFAQPVVIDKVESLVDWQTEIIWANDRGR